MVGNIYVCGDAGSERTVSTAGQDSPNGKFRNWLILEFIRLGGMFPSDSVHKEAIFTKLESLYRGMNLFSGYDTLSRCYLDRWMAIYTVPSMSMMITTVAWHAWAAPMPYCIILPGNRYLDCFIFCPQEDVSASKEGK